MRTVDKATIGDLAAVAGSNLDHDKWGWAAVSAFVFWTYAKASVAWSA